MGKRWFAALVVLSAVADARCLAAEPDAVVARVGKESIYASQVARLLKTATHERQISPEALPVFQAQVLEELVERRLVLAYARDRGELPSEAEVAAALARFESGLSAKGQSQEEHLKAQSLTEADLRRQVVWNLVWERYFAKYLTDPRVEAFWNEHRREFDGTEVQVSHILLRNDSANGPRATDDRVKQAEGIREEIVSGKLAFAQAAQKYSAGPSAKDGGRLGRIGRRGPMDESFSRAAFALSPGEVSRPVRTRFGVHLIRCDEIKPGDRGLAEVRKEVEDAMAQELLEKLAALQRRSTRVEYTGRSPYLKPDTHDLVVPR